MAIIKYSIGQITSIKDKNSVQAKESVVPEVTDEAAFVLICKQCGIQHMLLKDDSKRFCCGNLIKTDELS